MDYSEFKIGNPFLKKKEGSKVKVNFNIKKELHKKFKTKCIEQDFTISHILRRWIKDFVESDS